MRSIAVLGRTEGGAGASIASGIGAIAQVDLDVRQNRHQPLSALGPMASAVLDVVAERLRREGRLDTPPADLLERPPIASLTAAT